ncbi:MAG: hypothetical protein WD045_10775 [Pirellulaceae bacterium]
MAIASMSFSQQAMAGQNQANLTTEAGRLYNSARIFNNQVRGRAGFAHLNRETVRLLQATEFFMRSARTTNNPRQLRYDFEKVVAELEIARIKVRHALRNCGDVSVDRAWTRVEQDFDRIYFILYDGYRLPTHDVSIRPAGLRPTSHLQLPIQLGRPATSLRKPSLGMFLK